MTSLQQWTVELVGPKGYIHGWIKVGGSVEHKDSSRGVVTRYDKATQTAHVSWLTGPRSTVNHGAGTTKAYHLKQGQGLGPGHVQKPPKEQQTAAEFKPNATAVYGGHRLQILGAADSNGFIPVRFPTGSEGLTHRNHLIPDASAKPLDTDAKARLDALTKQAEERHKPTLAEYQGKAAELKAKGVPASDLTKPTIKNADLLGITIGKKVAVRNLPAGVTVHEVHGSSHSHAVFHNNEHIGYVNKRSGYSTLGRSGAAYMSKNTGYSAYDRRTSRLGDHSTISGAATHVHQSWQRTQGATDPKAWGR